MRILQKKRDLEDFIANNRLVLKGWQRLYHYLIPIFFFLLSLILASAHLYDLLFDEAYKPIHTSREILGFPLIIAIISLFLFFNQFRRLRFKKLYLQLKNDEFMELINRLEKYEHWSLVNQSSNVIYQFKSNYFRMSGCRLITIYFTEQIIKFNEIKDPSVFNLRKGVSLGIINEELRLFEHHAYTVNKQIEASKAPEFNDNQWSGKMILARLFLYPLCFFMIWMAIHVLKNGDMPMAILLMLIPLVYFTIDWVALAKSSKK